MSSSEPAIIRPSRTLRAGSATLCRPRQHQRPAAVNGIIQK